MNAVHALGNGPPNLTKHFVMNVEEHARLWVLFHTNKLSPDSGSISIDRFSDSLRVGEITKGQYEVDVMALQLEYGLITEEQNVPREESLMARVGSF